MASMQQIQQAAERVRQGFESRPGVIAVGYGFKRRGSELTDIPCVVVFVTEKRSLSALSATEVIPLEIEGAPTDVVQVKTVNALIFHAVYPGYKRPCPGGYSIGHPLVTAGTLGLPVVMKDGKKALLTNTHVAAPHGAGEVKAGDPIYQPGPYDGGPDTSGENEIARLLAWAPIDPTKTNRVDAALALIDESKVDWKMVAIPEVYEKAGPPEVGQPGDRVIKVGRTTGLTRGQITVVGAAINVNYGPFTALFVDQVEVVSVEGKPFFRGGDSGSVILSEDGKSVLGLLFAGDDTATYANPIALVQSAVGGFDIVPRPEPETIEKQLAGLAESLVTVWGYEAKTQRWLVYDPLAPEGVSTLKVLEKAKGYWVRVARDVSFSYHDQIYDLVSGWNLVGWVG